MRAGANSCSDARRRPQASTNPGGHVLTPKCQAEHHDVEKPLILRPANTVGLWKRLTLVACASLTASKDAKSVGVMQPRCKSQHVGHGCIQHTHIYGWEHVQGPAFLPPASPLRTRGWVQPAPQARVPSWKPAVQQHACLSRACQPQTKQTHTAALASVEASTSDITTCSSHRVSHGY